jgi:hypothetical protein
VFGKHRIAHIFCKPLMESVISLPFFIFGDCAEVFRSAVVGKIATHLKFTLDKTGKWSEVVHLPVGRGRLGGGTRYGTVDIWQHRKAKKV